MLICGLAVLGFLGKHFLAIPTERFILDPEMIRQGEWWRLFAYPVSEQLADPLWLLFYVLYVYFVMGALESHWGPGPLTFFTLLSYLTSIAGAFVVDRPVFVWFHVMENVSLAFGTLFPNLTLYIYFILPVKAKWLAFLAGGLLLFQFFSGGPDTKIFLALVLLPYFTFFGPTLYYHLRNSWKKYKNRNRMKDWR